MPLEIYCRKDNPVSLKDLKKGLRALMTYSKRHRAYLELSLVGEKGIRRLNRQYRKKDQVTDVLSFPQDVAPVFADAPWHLGEIFIATEVAKRQAKRSGRSLTQQVLRLAVHGFVHLHGLDHERSSTELKTFESFEQKYLNYLAKKGLMKCPGLLRL